MSDTCPVEHCARPWHQDRAICTHHAEQLERDIGDLPALVDELETTLARQGASGARTGGRGNEKPLPFDLGASEALAVLRGTLAAWSREIGTSGTALALLGAVAELVMHPDAADAIEEISSARRNALRAIDHHRELVYAGRCGDDCAQELYAQPGRPAVRCWTCGTEHLVAERQQDMLDAIQSRLCTVREITRLAAWSGEFTDSKRTEGLLNQWVHRGKLTAVGLDVRGRETYRFGEVLDLLRGSVRKSA